MSSRRIAREVCARKIQPEFFPPFIGVRHAVGKVFDLRFQIGAVREKPIFGADDGVSAPSEMGYVHVVERLVAVHSAAPVNVENDGKRPLPRAVAVNVVKNRLVFGHDIARDVHAVQRFLRLFAFFIRTPDQFSGAGNYEFI